MEGECHMSIRLQWCVRILHRVRNLAFSAPYSVKNVLNSESRPFKTDIYLHILIQITVKTLFVLILRRKPYRTEIPIVYRYFEVKNRIRFALFNVSRKNGLLFRRVRSAVNFSKTNNGPLKYGKLF